MAQGASTADVAILVDTRRRASARRHAQIARLLGIGDYVAVTDGPVGSTARF